jgi:hypothetical protein
MIYLPLLYILCNNVSQLTSIFVILMTEYTEVNVT